MRVRDGWHLDGPRAVGRGCCRAKVVTGVRDDIEAITIQKPPPRPPRPRPQRDPEDADDLLADLERDLPKRPRQARPRPDAEFDQPAPPPPVADAAPGGAAPPEEWRP